MTILLVLAPARGASRGEGRGVYKVLATLTLALSLEGEGTGICAVFPQLLGYLVTRPGEKQGLPATAKWCFSERFPGNALAGFGCALRIVQGGDLWGLLHR